MCGLVPKMVSIESCCPNNLYSPVTLTLTATLTSACPSSWSSLSSCGGGGCRLPPAPSGSHGTCACAQTRDPRRQRRPPATDGAEPPPTWLSGSGREAAGAGGPGTRSPACVAAYTQKRIHPSQLVNQRTPFPWQQTMGKRRTFR